MDKARIKNIVREVLKEIKVNNPNYKLPSHFPIKIENQDQYKNILRLLKDKGYTYQGGYPMDGSYMEYKKFPFWLDCTMQWGDEDDGIFAIKNGNTWIKQQKELGNEFSEITNRK